MPLIVFSVNTGHELISTVAAGMEEDGGFTLTHEFQTPPHEDTVFRLKQVFVNCAGDGRSTGLVDRGENKEPTVWLETHFPDMEEPIVASKRNVYRALYSPLSNGVDVFSNTPKLIDTDVIRFPITCYPISGFNGNKNSNRVSRQDNSSVASHYEARGNHFCDIPLGKMKLKDNVLSVRFIPRDHLARNMIFTNPRRVRIRNISMVLEYQ